MNKRILIALTFGACLIAQGPTVTTETMTAEEYRAVVSVTARITAAQQALNAAQAAMREARTAEAEMNRTILGAHGNTGYGPWKVQPDGSIVRSYHLVEIRGNLLIHTQDKAETCPSESVKSSGSTYICFAPGK